MSILNSHIEKANRVAIKNLASKTAITLSHQFADITARDAYFVLNPTELVDNLFIKVGTGYQQYLSSIWEDVSAVVIEQLTAAGQTLVDAGGHYTVKNVEGALQEVGERINTLDALKATKAEVALKADTTTVQSNYSTLDKKINSQASGSPKSTFATLALLEADSTANTLDGNKYIYVVTADGNWYYWNGSAWTIGGVYQSVGIDDGGITPPKNKLFDAR